MPITGRDLRVERRLADVTVVDVAARMGLSRQALWAMERSAVVKPERAAAYREALRAVIETAASAA
jgi:transcriptional regulator with XRE-family HTH domain